MAGVSRAIGAALGVGAACVVYGVVIERRWYRLRRLRIEGVLRRPGRLTVLQVSDLHLLPGQHDRIRFLASLAELGHDLVVASGDLLGAPDMEDTAAASLAPLTAHGAPGLAVLGSNDRYGPARKSPFSYFTDPQQRVFGPALDTDRLVERLTAHGYRTLDSEVAVVDTAAGRVVAGGMDDPHLPATRIPDPATIAPQAAGAAAEHAVVRQIGRAHV